MVQRSEDSWEKSGIWWQRMLWFVGFAALLYVALVVAMVVMERHFIFLPSRYDAAAFVPTGLLDLSKYHPDYVALSFYKMFGYPTGVGCLVARKAALSKLDRPWFAGSTIDMASVQAEGYHLSEGEAAFEEDTVNYLNLPDTLTKKL